MRKMVLVMMVMVTMVMTLVTCSRHEIYSTTMVVTNVIEGGSQKNDLVYAVDSCGEEWEFEADDLEVDDMVSVTMCNNCTPNNIYDDIVINVRYCAFK